jgi:hypothetical protein
MLQNNIYLYRKAGAATTGAACIRIAEGKAPGVQSILPVNLHAQQIHLMSLMHEHRDSINDECLIAFF